MDATADELAGVVDLFGGLTRSELERALSEVAFRADGGSVDADDVDQALEEAVASLALVRDDRPEEPLYVAGPTAFPSPPDHAEDLPHILEVEPRQPDLESLGEQLADRFADRVDAAVAAGDDDAARRLVDASYDVETWAPVELDAERERLDDLLE